jgi:hypothetical protein
MGMRRLAGQLDIASWLVEMIFIHRRPTSCIHMNVFDIDGERKERENKKWRVVWKGMMVD